MHLAKGAKEFSHFLQLPCSRDNAAQSPSADDAVLMASLSFFIVSITAANKYTIHILKKFIYIYIKQHKM